MYSIEEIKEKLPELSCHHSIKLPMMPTDKLEGLKFDILKNGMRNPIWVVKGQILDGRARYLVLLWLKANEKLNFKPDIREWHNPDDNFDSVVKSMNIHRSSYNSQQLAAYATLHFLPKLKEEALERMHKKVPKELFPDIKGTANSLAALQVGTNEKYMQYACRIKEKNLNFLDFVLNELMTLNEGLEFIELKSEAREFIFDQMKANIPYEKAKIAYEELMHPKSNMDLDEDNNQSEKISKGKKRKKSSSPINGNKQVGFGVYFSAKIDVTTLEAIKEVLYKGGYSEQSYKIWVAKNANVAKEVYDKLEPLVEQLPVIAYIVEPQDSVVTIDSVLEG